MHMFQTYYNPSCNAYCLSELLQSKLKRLPSELLQSKLSRLLSFRIITIQVVTATVRIITIQVVTATVRIITIQVVTPTAFQNYCNPSCNAYCLSELLQSKL